MATGATTGATTAGRQRVDRWLWAARFFKSRSLARQAAELGRVEINDRRARPAAPVTVGDRLCIRTPGGEYTVVVEALNTQRRPAPEARTLYSETEASRAAREREVAERRQRRAAVTFDAERPDRRTRREAIRRRRRPGSGD